MIEASGTRPVTLLMAGMRFEEWSRVEVARDLQDIAGKFRLELRDSARSWRTFPFATLADMKGEVELGLEATILLDGEQVLSGWVDDLAPHASEGQVSVSISGQDKTGDLSDCAATVDGPAEYFGKTIDTVAGEILKPYGLKVRAEADVGDPFDRFAIDVGETALSAIEKGARQRGLLVTSDGMDTLLLTQSGGKRAPGDLIFPGNIVESGGHFSLRGRHSAYHVKGQAERAGGRRRKTVHLDGHAEPLTGEQGDWQAQQGPHEKAGVTIKGQADDAAMKRRHRPLVAMGRTQLTPKGAQDQAEWMRRTARGRSEELTYQVRGFRHNGRLWRPNELGMVQDAFQGVYREMLIAGVAYQYDDEGAATHLRVTGPEAYDMQDEGTRRKNHKSQQPLDRHAEPLG
ncbi:Mu P family protein [Xanthobacter sp. DSM 24535]|uniref:phage baseplate assembly protein n=1 Tax=Roseixanthobacter psychrophilus TaxID=3119917 RepID=UPI0037299202